MTNEQKVLKYMCEDSLLFYARYIYKENHNRKFIQSKHFEEIAKFLEDVFFGRITRGIINMPPRYGKTELVIKIFVSWCLAKVPVSKFIHLSYSDTLALDNSSETKEYIQSEAFQSLWKMNLKKDAQSKKKWFNEYGGGMYATAAGGAITGFGAGVDGLDYFTGAILIDDPLKPDDAFSEIERGKVNKRYNNTIRSRTNTDKTPIIIIMQRLHEDDLSGFLLNGGSGEEWNHLCLPALDKNNNPLYPHKHTFEQLEQIRQADRYTFAGQYMQTPAPDEGGEWRKNWFSIIKKQELPQGIRWQMYIDGAYTKDTKNDPTGIMIAGKYKNDLYIYSSIDKYLELPELIKYIPTHIETLGLNISIVKIEPKASGKSIVQLLKQQTKLNVTEIKTDFVKVSKIERARTSSPYIEGGRVHLIEGSWNDSYLRQIATFPNAKHDEHIDLTSYAIEDAFMTVSRRTRIRV
jgi:predicted phage terminase large subunit-like protein